MQTRIFTGPGWARLRRHWMVPVLLAGLVLSLSGLTGRAWSAIIRPISAHNDLFLAQSVSDTLHLMVPVGIAKAAADVIEGSTIDVQAGAVLASAGMRIEAGDTLQPLLDYIDVAWKILMASLVWQIGARCLLRGAPMLGEPLVAVACACALAGWLAEVCWPSVERLRQALRRVAGIAWVGAAVLMIVLPLTIRFTAYLGERTTAPLRAEVTASFDRIGRICSLRGLQECVDIQEKARFMTTKMREIGAYAWEGTGEVAGAVAKLAVVKLLNGIIFPLLSLGFLVWVVKGVLLPPGGWGKSTGVPMHSGLRVLAGAGMGVLLAAVVVAVDADVGVNGAVNAVVCAGDGTLYVGGEFTAAGGVPANHIAKWDGQAWSALGDGLDGYVHALACDSNGDLYAGGEFRTAGGQEANYIAKWDGLAWTALVVGADNGMDDFVLCLACDPAGNVYAGGLFTSAGSHVVNGMARWNGSAWASLGTGMNGPVAALAYASATELYAAGVFDIAGGIAANNIARWNGASWSALNDGLTGLDGVVLALARDQAGNLYAGGSFDHAGSIPVSRVAKWSGAPGAWSSVGGGIGVNVSDWVATLVCDDAGRVYAGGAFDFAGGVRASGVAQYIDSDWASLGAGVTADHRAYALARDGDGGIYVGGAFLYADGMEVNRIARWSGSAWLPLGPAPRPAILSITASGTADMTVQWSATNGVWYALQWAAAPGDSIWNDVLPTNRVGPASPPWVLCGTNVDARLDAGARFYRVRAARVP